MATIYQWTGKDTKGETKSGEIIAEGREDAIEQLKKKSIDPSKVTEKKGVGKKKVGGVKEVEIVVFTRQLATMIDAGLPLIQALDILATQVEGKNFRTVLTQVKMDVESGSTFADSLKKYPRVFSDLYANLIEAGEAGGLLDTILHRLATYIEKAASLKKKVKSAMVYPAVVGIVAISVIAIIMIFVVPTFSKMFTSLGGTLPAPTRVVIMISSFISGIGGLIVAVGMVGAVVFIIQARKVEKGRYVIDKILLQAPIFGNILRKSAIAKFTRTLGTLMASGVAILDGLEITAKTAGNKVIEKSVFEVKAAVAEGKTIAEPLMKSKIFPPLVTQMIAVGESTGALDAMLTKIADFFEDEVDTAVDGLTALIEPLLMVFLGGAVGFIIIAMYMPIFKMGTLVK